MEILIMAAFHETFNSILPEIVSELHLGGGGTPKMFKINEFLFCQWTQKNPKFPILHVEIQEFSK